MKRFIFALIIAAGPVSANCPASPDISSALDALVAQAQAAPDETTGQGISDEMWLLWLKAPDAAAQEVLDRGMRARSSYDYLGAIEAFTDLISYCPAYAEGYNQRAFIHFLREDYDAALADLDAALARQPVHVGAQSGRALTLMHLGRRAEARQQLQAALAHNPWLSERFLMGQGGPLAPVGEEI